MDESKSSSTKQYFYAFDYIKFLLCFIVVAIHVDIFCPIQENSILSYLEQIAVPIFFVITGFFFGNKRLEGHDILLYVKKYLSLYLLWALIYAPIAIIHYQSNNFPFFKCVLITVKNYLFCGENYLAWSLWYLHSLVLSFLVIYLFRKIHLHYILIFLFGVILYLSTYYVLNHQADPKLQPFALRLITALFKLFASLRTFLGLVYVSAGVLISKYAGFLSKKQILILSILFFILSITECPLRRIFGASSVVLIALLSKCNKPRKESLWMREISTIIYLIHLIIITSFIGFNFCNDSFCALYLSTALTGFVLAEIILCLVKIKKFHWLITLYKQ